MAVRGKLNIKQLLKKNYSNSRVLQNLAYGTAKKKSDALKKEALREFDQHEVTKELEKGTSGMSSSLLGGRGNFFGFLGFSKGYQPVQVIRDILENHINIRNTKGKLKKVSATSFLWEFDIDIPSKAEIYAATATLPWTTKSWVKGVEGGIRNYRKTVFKNEGSGDIKFRKSNSGIALQSRQNIGFITFSPTPYITTLLDKLKKQLK